MSAVLSPREFRDAFDRVRSSVFRLETLQRYAGDEDPLLDAFLAGRPCPPDPGKDEWTGVVRAGVREQHTFQRVHVVTEPLTDYMRFELSWSYPPNVAAGEDVRIVPVAAGEGWPAELPQLDFWLLDDSDVYVMAYDAQGRWSGVEHVTGQSWLAPARQSRQLALERSVPWVEYVRSRPELAAHLSPETLRRAS